MRENLSRGKKLCLALCALLCCALFPAAALAEVEAPLRAAFASDDSRSSFLASLNSVGLPGQECQDGESPALALYQKSALEQASVIALSDGYAGTGVRFPDEIIVTYGQTLQEGRFIGGEGAGRFVLSAEENLSSRPDVSDTGAMLLVDFIPNSAANYSWNSDGESRLTGRVALRVEPAAAEEIAFPERANIRYGKPLAQARFARPKQSGEYAFINSALVLEWAQNGHSFDMAYYPSDTVNYDYSGLAGWDEARGAVVRRVQVEMQKGEGEVSVPLLEPVEYDPSVNLSQIALPEGWAWEDGAQVPSVGNEGYDAIYTPRDTDNYDYSAQPGWDARSGTIRCRVPLVVAKAEPKVEVPAISARDFEKGAKLEDVPLPDGWSWQEPDAVLWLGEKGYIACYTPQDTANYSQVFCNVLVEVRPEGFAGEVLHSLFWAGACLAGMLAVSAVFLIRSSLQRKRRAQVQKEEKEPES